MTKIAPVLLVLVGLAVGLWLGFNPHAHQQVVQDWDRARLAFIHATASLHLSSKVALAPKSTTRVEPITTSPSANAALKQITTAFQSLVSSLQRLWLQITARV